MSRLPPTRLPELNSGLAKYESVQAAGWALRSALSQLSRGGAEVPEVAGRPGGLVLVVARSRPRPRLVPAPGRVVAVGELGVGAALVGVVARRRDGSGLP